LIQLRNRALGLEVPGHIRHLPQNLPATASHTVGTHASLSPWHSLPVPAHRSTSIRETSTSSWSRMDPSLQAIPRWPTRFVPRRTTSRVARIRNALPKVSMSLPTGSLRSSSRG
jgi:hypothetical protein